MPIGSMNICMTTQQINCHEFMLSWPQVELLAGPVHAPACSYAVAGATAASATVAAGAPLQLAVTARDAFGNLAALPAGALRVAAAGPQGTVPFEVEVVGIHKELLATPLSIENTASAVLVSSPSCSWPHACAEALRLWNAVADSSQR